MAPTMARVWLCCMSAGVAWGMFGDQAGVLDRQEHYLGAATHVVKLDGALAGSTPHSMSIAASAKLLVLSTEANVLAGVNERTQETAWRFIIPNGESLRCSSVSFGTLFALSSWGSHGSVLRLIAPTHGTLQQEFRVATTLHDDVACATSSDGTSASFLFTTRGVAHIVDVVRGVTTHVPLHDDVNVVKTVAIGSSSTFFLGTSTGRLVRLYSISGGGEQPVTLLASLQQADVKSLGLSRLASTSNGDAGAFLLTSSNASHVHATRLQVRSYSDISSAVVTHEALAVAHDGVTLNRVVEVPDATASASAALAFVAHMSDATQRVLFYSDATVEVAAEGDVAQVDLNADGEVRSSTSSSSGTHPRWQTLRSEDTQVVAGSASIGVEVVLGVAQRDIIDSTLRFIILDGQRGVTLPSPVFKAVLRSLHVLPYLRKEGGHGVRVLAVCENGATFLTAAGGVLWQRQEARAQVRNTLGFDVPAMREGEQGQDDVDLTFAARMADQARMAQQGVNSVLEAGTRMAADPLGSLMALLAPPARTGGVIAPLKGAGSVKVLLQSTSVDSCAASTTTWAGVNGVLAASEFDTGATRWTLDTPVDARVRREGAAGRITTGACPLIKSSVLISRAHAVADQAPEVLLVETAPIAQSVLGEHIIALTWLNVVTGQVTGMAHHVTSAPLESIARTPVTHADSHRAVYALLLRDATALIAPGTPDVISTLTVVQSEYTIVRSGDAHVVRAVGLAPPARHVPSSASNDSVPVTLVDVRERWTYIASEEASKADTPRILALHTDASLPHVIFSHDYDAGHVSGTGETRARAALAVSEGALASAVQIRGDDSLLIKHVNPHIITLVVGLQGSAEVETGDADTLALGSKAPLAPMVLILLDASSGRVLHSRSHSNAVGPVHVLRHEHWVVYTYWNMRIGRQELSCAAMYDGLIDAQGLTPWKKPRWMASAGATKSSFGVELPIVMHRSYILPTSVSGLAITRSTEGVTVPHLLMTTPTGSVIMLDRRMVDPRRPSGEPNDGEKAEGLMKYSPLLPLRHSWQVTRNVSIPRISAVSSFPSAYESCTLIAVTGVDHFYARASPSRLFDQLDTDFNPVVFIAIVAGLGIVTFVLGTWIRRKDLEAAWQ